MEEALLMTYGGVRREGGFLSNLNHAPGMGAGGVNFIASVNTLLKDFQYKIVLQSAFLNGSVGSLDNFGDANDLSDGDRK